MLGLAADRSNAYNVYSCMHVQRSLHAAQHIAFGYGGAVT